MMIKIVINEKPDADQPVNLHWPRTGLTGMLDRGGAATFGFLTKIDPTVQSEANLAGITEVDKLDFSIKWKHDVEMIAKHQADEEKKKKATTGADEKPSNSSSAKAAEPDKDTQ